MKLITMMLALSVLAMATYNQTDPFSHVDKIVENTLNSIDKFLENFYIILKNHISSISKSLSVITGLTGAILYFSGLSRHSGRGLMMGAVALYVLSQIAASM